MLEVGGVVTQLFYWELVTAKAEIVKFMGWARENGWDTSADILGSFEAYCSETARDDFVRSRDPLSGG